MSTHALRIIISPWHFLCFIHPNKIVFLLQERTHNYELFYRLGENNFKSGTCNTTLTLIVHECIRTHQVWSATCVSTFRPLSYKCPTYDHDCLPQACFYSSSQFSWTFNKNIDLSSLRSQLYHNRRSYLGYFIDLASKVVICNIWQTTIWSISFRGHSTIAITFFHN